jgi:predicted aldo/keto reductase-like oxidoreductase
MANLPTCNLGRSGPAVTAIGFGLMGLSTSYGTVESDLDRFKVLDRAFEMGEKFWDTADVYGDSEDLVGKWFKRTGKRNEASILALEFPSRRPAENFRVEDQVLTIEDLPSDEIRMLLESGRHTQSTYRPTICHGSLC